jgi:hypothetical protein
MKQLRPIRLMTVGRHRRHAFARVIPEPSYSPREKWVIDVAAYKASELNP